MTQKESIVKYLRKFGTITPIQAFSDLGITKLSTRIGELRQEGHKIGQTMVKAKNRYGVTTKFCKYWEEYK